MSWIFCLLIYTNNNVFYDFLKISDLFPKIFEDFAKAHLVFYWSVYIISDIINYFSNESSQGQVVM